MSALAGLCLLGLPRAGAAPAPTAIPRFTVTDLGTLGGATSIALGINDGGQVVGGAQTANGVTHAFLWERGRMTDLGSAGPDAISIARAVNSVGQAVGESSAPHGPMHAFLWQRGRATDLGTLGGNYGAVNAINDQGQVVGQFSAPSGERCAFRWKEGPVQTWDPLGGNLVSARAINNHGEVVATMAIGHGRNFLVHSVLWDDGRITDLGAFSALAINDHGEAVGAVADGTSPFSPAATWRGGQTTRLPRLNSIRSVANGINDQEQIVGSGDIPMVGTRTAEAVPHALFWAGGQCEDLNERIAADAGWVLEDAEHINNHGQIVGLGEHGGKQRAFLLTPIRATK